MTRKTVSFRLPERIAHAIEAQAQATGKNKTTLIVEILTQAYGLSQPPAHQITPEMLLLQLDELKQQVAVLSIGESSAPTEGEQSGGAQDLIARIESQTQAFDWIFSAVPDPLFVCNRQGRIAYINPTGARMLKIERGKTLGKHYQEMNLPPDVMASLQPQLETALMNGKFSHGEFSLHTSSQTRHYEYWLNPILERDNTIDGVIGVTRDTTQYKQIEAELRATRAQYRNLFELANDWMFIIHASTDQILVVNSQASKRLGYTRQELCRQSFGDISPPEAATHYKTVIVPELERTGNGVFEHTLRHRNGQEIPVEISNRLIEYQDQLVFECSARELIRE